MSEVIEEIDEQLRVYGAYFLELRERYDRSLVRTGGRLACGDLQLNLDFHIAEETVNDLLERRFEETIGQTALIGVASGEIIAEHIEAQHVRGTE